MSEPAARLHQSFYQRHESLILGGGSIVLILGLWEAAWKARLISPLFFSGPSAIAKQMVYAWTRGHLKSDLIYSGTNFLLGFAGAVILFALYIVLLVAALRVALRAKDPFRLDPLALVNVTRHSTGRTHSQSFTAWNPFSISALECPLYCTRQTVQN